jgi:hypothetical protein
MALHTFGGTPSAVLTTATGDVVPDYPVIVRVAGSGAPVTALFEADGTTPIAQLRSNPADSDTPGAIRDFKIEDVPAIQYEYIGPSGDPVRWYEASREAVTSALEGLGGKLDKTGGTITGNLTVTGTLDTSTLLVNGAPLDLGAHWEEAGILVPTATTGAALQAALTAASTAGGGWVIVPPGTYNVSALPLRIYRNTRLTLCDGAVIRRAGPGTMLLNGDASQNYGGYTGHGSIVIEGGVWDARAADYPTSAMCISIGHAEDVTIRDTVIKDVCGYHAVEMNSTKRGRIINVAALGYKDPDGTRTFSEAFQIDLAKGSSYFGGFGPYDDVACQDILVQGCSVGPSGTAGTTSWPRAFGSHSASPSRPHTDIRVRDLRCEGLTQYAIGGYTWQDVIVSGLQLRNCGAGVRMRTLDSSSAAHRTPAGGGSPTITGSQPLTNIVIDDITMTGGGTYDAAVKLEGEDTGYIGGVQIGRIVTRSIGQQALRLVDVEDYSIIGVTAHTCGATAVSQLGVRRGQVHAVHVNGATGAGITVDSRSTPAATATDVTISGCTVTGTTANGIHIWDGTDVTVTDCDVYALTGYGVQVSTNTVRPVIRDVRTRDTTLAGINLTTTVLNPLRRGNTADAPGAKSTGTAASTTAETVVASVTIPAADAWPGVGYRFAAHGTASTTGTPTLTIRVRLGGVTGAVIAAFSAVTTGSAISGRGWRVEGVLHSVTIGASGTWAGGAALIHHLASTTGAALHETTDAPVTRDSTVDQALVVTAQWSVSSASNTASATAVSMQRVA